MPLKRAATGLTFLFVTLVLLLHFREAFGQSNVTRPCTSIPVELSDLLDSAKVRPGAVFRFRTIDTILAAGGIALPRDATGYGIVTAVAAAGSHGRAGALSIEARYIDLRRHGQFQVMIDTIASSAMQNGSTGNVPSGITVLPIPFAGTAIGAFNYLHAGKNVAIKPGFRFVVVPVDDLDRGIRCAL
jgi:hypothetical protein